MQPKNPNVCDKRRQKYLRQGSTLLDVALGSSLLSLLLIPSMFLMGQTQRNTTRSQKRQRLILEADRIMQLVRVELRDRKTLDQAFASARKELVKVPIETIPGCLARTIITPEPMLGTSTTPLVTIVVDVWQDVNQNQNMDADEVSQTIQTQQGQW